MIISTKCRNYVLICEHQQVLNSIDAKASEIIVSVSWSLFTLSVNDNGCGMSKEELENITSK